VYNYNFLEPKDLQ